MRRTFANSWAIARMVHEQGDVRVTFAFVQSASVTDDETYARLLAEARRMGRWERVTKRARLRAQGEVNYGEGCRPVGRAARARRAALLASACASHPASCRQVGRWERVTGSARLN